MTDFRIFNQTVRPGTGGPLRKHIGLADRITLSRAQSTFSFKFAALNFRIPQKNNYAYKMDGYDLNWTPADSEHREAKYTNLDPGRYLFQVKGSNNDGLWNEEGASIELIITPAWFETIWFRSMVLFGVAVVMFGLLRWRVYATEQRSLELESQVELRTQALQKSELALRSARDAAERANRAKSDFLATVTHELRTPLNGIVGMAQLLLKSVNDVYFRNQVKIINESAQTLTILVDDILDFSILESERTHFDTTSFNPNHLINGVIQLMKPRAEEKGLSLSIDNKIYSSITLVSAPNRLHQILFNLIMNAIKFTDQGQVSVRTRVDSQGADQEIILHFEVEDSGIGIAEEDKSIIFNLFQQADQSSERNHGGMGLGLAISKRITELLDGSITFSSQQGEGSTFIVDIPCQVSKQETISCSDENTRIQSSLHILLVEDLTINQKVATAMVQSFGHQVMIVDNGQAALQAIENHSFDLILMDIRMPGMDGIHITDTIRKMENPKKSKTPIYAYTANQTALKGRQAYLKLGFNGVLAKPIQIDELEGLLRGEKALNIKSVTGSSDQNKIESLFVNQAYIDKEIALIGVNKVLELFQFFKEDGDKIMTALSSRSKADNLPEIREFCHKLASASLNVGLTALGKQAKKIEQHIEINKLSNVPEQLKELHVVYADSVLFLNQYLNAHMGKS